MSESFVFTNLGNALITDNDDRRWPIKGVYRYGVQSTDGRVLGAVQINQYTHKWSAVVALGENLPQVALSRWIEDTDVPSRGGFQSREHAARWLSSDEDRDADWFRRAMQEATCTHLCCKEQATHEVVAETLPRVQGAPKHEAKLCGKHYEDLRGRMDMVITMNRGTV